MLLGRATLQALLAVTLLILLGVVVFGRWRPRSSLWNRSTVLAIGLVFLFWLPAVVFSINAPASFLTWLRTLLFVLACGLVHLHLAERPAALRLCLQMLIAASFVLSVVTVVRLELAPSEALRFKAASSALACLMVVVPWAGHRVGGRWIAAGWAALLPMLAVCLLTGSRSSLAGLLIGLGAALVFAALRDRRLWPPAILLAVVAIGGGLIHLSNRALVGEEWSLYAPAWLIDPHRQMIWRFVFERWLDSPLIGCGINVANELPGAKAILPGIQAETLPSHPHNWALEILVETGVVGFVPLLAAILWRIGRAVGEYRRHGHRRDLALAVLLVVFWSSALFNFSLWATWWMLTLMALYAIVAADRRDA